MATVKTKGAGRAVGRQVAALPWRVENGQRRILMITSRETRRWVIPKGGRMAGLTDAQAAAQEAYEEAGIKGSIDNEPIGSFKYIKLSRNGTERSTVVDVYPLEVLVQLGSWPEAHERERHWMTTDDAAACVNEPDLADLIRTFAGMPIPA